MPSQCGISTLKYSTYECGSNSGSYQTPVDSSPPQRGWRSGMISVPVCVCVHLRSVCLPFLSSAAGGRSSTDDLPELSAPLAEECWNPGGQCDWPLG